MSDRYGSADRRPPSPRNLGSSFSYRPSYDRESSDTYHPPPRQTRDSAHPVANGGHALPPRPVAAPRYDDRRPSQSSHELYGPRPSHDHLPPMRRFGASSSGDHYAPSQNDFTFRVSERDGPHYPAPTQDSRRSRPPPRGPRGYVPRTGDGRPRPYNRPLRRKIATADRPLLRFDRRSNTPEQLEGMNADSAAATYRNIEEMSDSDEQSMVESEDEDSPAEVTLADTKRLKVESHAKTKSDEAPRWSNAELYTALPPLEDATERKRRDVVKLIRKARVVAQNESTLVKPLGGDDFISFGFEDEQDDAESNVPPSEMPQIPEQSVAVLVEAPNGSNNQLALEKSVASRFATDGLKRKRDDTDEGGRLLAPRQKIGRGPVLNGEIVADWKERIETDPTPWVKRNHIQTATGGFRLHKEICDFFEFVKPQPFEQQMRQDLLDRLQAFISNLTYGNCTVHAFGSFAAGLYLPNSDMDVVVVSRRYLNTGVKEFAQTKSEMWRLARKLQNSFLAADHPLEIIAGAKVPIVKFVDPRTRLNVDMSFENTTGLAANVTFQRWKSQFPAMPILVTLIKQFVMMRGLNNVANGGIGGFSITCLVVSLLQNLPLVQLGEVQPEAHLGEMLLEFLDYYGNQLDIMRTAIRMEPPALLEKSQVPYLKLNDPNKRGRLCIIDPNRSDNDISGGSKEIGLIFRRFAAAREQLLTVLERPESHASLLRCCIGGNYNDFLWHRWQLRKAYEQQFGQIPLALDEHFITTDPIDLTLDGTSTEQQISAQTVTNKISAKANDNGKGKNKAKKRLRKPFEQGQPLF